MNPFLKVLQTPEYTKKINFLIHFYGFDGQTSLQVNRMKVSAVHNLFTSHFMIRMKVDEFEFEYSKLFSGIGVSTFGGGEVEL